MMNSPAWQTIVRKINEDTMEEMKAKALGGDCDLQYALGKYYSAPKHKNHSEAIKWFTMAAEGGFAPALMDLADRYFYGYHIEKDVQEGLRLYNLAIEGGDVDALVRLGKHYSHGRWLDQDKKEAFRLFKLAAEQGYGLSELAMCYYNGDGVAQDYDEAFRLFTLDGDKEMLGECYLHGRGVERNIEKTIELWEDEEFDGIYVIYEKLANLYSDGIYMEPNYEKAVYYLWEFIQDDYFEDRIKATHPELAYRLATYYYEGKGVRKNRSQALKLFKLTIDGFHEFDKRGGCAVSEEPDYVIEARKMLVKHGKKSMINLLQKAAANGDQKAKEILKEFGIELAPPKPKKAVVKKEEKPKRPVYEKPAPPPPVAISVGETVIHKSYGQGTVCHTEERRIVVRFQSVGEKTFINPEAFLGGYLTK